MNRRDASLAPELEALVRPQKVARTVPPELRMRALSRARAFLAADGSNLPAATNTSPSLVSISSPPLRARVRIAVAAVLAVAAGAAGAVAAFRERAPEPAPGVTAFGGSPILAARTVQPALAPRAEPLPARPQPAHRVRPAAPIRSGGAERHFTAELELLQRAQAAYTGHEFSTALGLIAEHTHRFSRGHLAEEREALRVRCLSGAGRTDEAHRAATEFAARFPRSVLLPRIDSAESD